MTRKIQNIQLGDDYIPVLLWPVVICKRGVGFDRNIDASASPLWSGPPGLPYSRENNKKCNQHMYQKSVTKQWCYEIFWHLSFTFSTL